MFILANLFESLAHLLDVVITLYIWIVIIRAVLSWINPDPYNPIVRFLYNITDPVLHRIRRYLPPMGGFDLSPLVLIFGLYFIELFLVRTLYDLARVMR
ncbi:MAG: YggT family protein [Calditrichaeota bacterium]|nr:MAG: YggT family protein [Calditrichota bacterium]